MEWDDHRGINYITGSHPLDQDLEPQVGERVKITANGYEFEVEIYSVDGESLEGVVRVIGPAAALEAEGIYRGDRVSFTTTNVSILYRK